MTQRNPTYTELKKEASGLHCNQGEIHSTTRTNSRVTANKEASGYTVNALQLWGKLHCNYGLNYTAILDGDTL